MDRSGDPASTYCVIPGAASSGLVWEEALGQLGGTLLPVPDAPDVFAMASELEEAVRRLAEPRVLVGASLGAMVALEIARSVPVQALVLIAAGYGITVSDSLLDWVRANPPDLLAKMAKASLGGRDDPRMIETVIADYESRGAPVVLRHLQALAAYRPAPLPSPPPTLVVWGEGDRSVPLADHMELALRCGGALAPVADAAHMPFLEQPDATVRWIRTAAACAEGGAGKNPRGAETPDLGC